MTIHVGVDSSNIKSAVLVVVHQLHIGDAVAVQIDLRINNNIALNCVFLKHLAGCAVGVADHVHVTVVVNVGRCNHNIVFCSGDGRFKRAVAI